MIHTHMNTSFQTMDDVLNPRLVWVKGSCFRVLDHDQGGGTSAATYDGPDLYEAEFSTAADAGIEDDEFIGIPGLTIEATSDGQHLAKVPVAAAFYPRIIGKGGQTRRRIETETSTRINVPKTVSLLMVPWDKVLLKLGWCLLNCCCSSAC